MREAPPGMNTDSGVEMDLATVDCIGSRVGRPEAWRARRLPACAASLSLVIAALAAGLRAYAAEPGKPSPTPAYGAADFVPTPQTPVGFRADGNGWYPGATPVAEFWESTPRPLDPKDPRSPYMLSGDGIGKNILWKAALPGQSDSQPVVAGGRVVVMCDPHFVVCYDVATGKKLWQDELEINALPVLRDDGTLGPTPDAATAKKRQVLWELAHAALMLGNVYAPHGKSGEAPPGLKDHSAIIVQRLEEWQALARANDPDPAFLAALTHIRDVYAAWSRGETPARDSSKFASVASSGALSGFAALVAKKYQVPIACTWWGDIVHALASPVTDGAVVAVTFASGQQACYDLETGRRLWAWRDPFPGLGAQGGSSPTMWGDLVLMPSPDYNFVRGIEKKTGKIRWNTKISPTDKRVSAWKSHYSPNMLLHVPDGKSGVLPVLMTNNGGPLLRPADGKIIGMVNQGEGSGGWGKPGRVGNYTASVGRGSYANVASSWDNGGAPTYTLKLTVVSPDEVRSRIAWQLPHKQGSWGGGGPVLTDRFFISPQGGLVDVATGEILGNWFPAGRHWSSILAGSTYITMDREIPYKPPYGQTFDPAKPKLIGGRFTLTEMDPESGAGRPISSSNRLGGAELQANIFFDKHLRGLEKWRNLGTYRGMQPWFVPRLGGPTPRGDKLFIQTIPALYCIGPAVKGTPADDPNVVAAIRAAKAQDLAGYLASPSAQYRYEAATAMSKAGIGAAKDALAALVGADPYEEIRAAAVLALDAADPSSAPGTRALLDQMMRVSAWGGDDFGAWEEGRQSARRAVRFTLAALGDRGKPLLARALAGTQDPKARRAVVDFACWLGWTAPAITEQARALAKSREDNRLGVRYLAQVILTDEAVRSMFAGTYAAMRSDLLRHIVLPLGRALAGKEKTDFLMHCVRSALGPHDADLRRFALRQLRDLGTAAAAVLPDLEKLAVEQPKLAGEIAPAVDAIKRGADTLVRP